MKISLKKGFTLIELLVVISIIALLTSVVLGQLNDARAKARDRALVQQVHQIQDALELYKNKYGIYPNGNAYLQTSGAWSTTGGANINLSNVLLEFLPAIPPAKTGRIAYYGNGNGYCSDQTNTNRPPYVIAVTFETGFKAQFPTFKYKNNSGADSTSSEACFSLK